MFYRIWKAGTRKYLQLLYKFNSEKYKEQYPVYLRKIGVSIPQDYRAEGHGFIHPSVSFDGNDYSMISIGKGTTISADVVLLTHDYSITKGLNSLGIEASARFLKPISIGENSFIGMRSVILPGTVIGNNTVIGAGSIVSGKIPDRVVAAGNPARVICTVEEWARRHMEKQDYILEK